MWVYLRWENWATQWPAPDGFHVPLTSERAAIVSAWVSDGAWGSNGWSNMKAYLKLPYCWTRSYLNWNVDWYQDRKWTYWSSSQRDSARWYCLFFQDSQILSQNSDQTISWCSVRPFYNKSVTPDSSWTALYSDKIYHNSSLWLISVKNWSSWITIADKNVWATTVYNSWDTLSESNCWKFFQRWNNYWFPYTWSVTTSGTQVNAGTYWPNNYYSSSTFITRNSNPYSWDSSNNANLWWWVDGNVLVQKELQNAYIWEYVPPYLCFTANTAGSTVKLIKTWTPTAVTLETSTDGDSWSTYTFGSTITLSNIWDKVYWRNTSTTDTWFCIDSGNYYSFDLSWNVVWSGDVTYLLNKNGTDTLSSYCFRNLFINQTSLIVAPNVLATTLAEWCCNSMFFGCTWLTTASELPATTLAESCYYQMFRWCSSLTALPNLPATTLSTSCYQFMFYGCSKIKLSTTQTWDYQTEYRVPTTWTWSTWTNSLTNMFASTWWTFTWTPSINTTYYTSNTLV